SPFHQCGEGFTTYPDPTTCCDLNDPKNCAEPPPPPPGPPPTCAYACAPGWWPVENTPGECCILNPEKNALDCTQVAWAVPGYAGGGAACSDPGEPVDAGPPTVDAGEPIDGGPAPDADPPPDLDGGVVDASPP